MLGRLYDRGILRSRPKRSLPTGNKIRLPSTARSLSSGSASRQVIFSGIQPTGVPHIGNYLGALRQWVRLQDEAEATTRLLYSIVDLHAITAHHDAESLRRRRRETLATLLAVGLDPERSIIFCQSAVPAHCELMWILSCTASMGYLSRMTQWKSKLSLPDDASLSDEKARGKLRLGLFSYPVLQAADILVHRATHVPVGEDQAQHLEFARQCAIALNSTYGKVLPPPETILSPAKRIMSLREPHKKMSKSDPNPKSMILITESAEAIHQKIKAAVTDSMTDHISYDPENRPGVSNLLEIMSHFDERRRTPEELAREHEHSALSSLKERVAESVVHGLTGVQAEFERIMAADEGRYLDHVASRGAEKARQSAQETMALVRQSIGL